MVSGVLAGYVLTGGDWKGAIVGGVAGVISDLDEPKSKFGKVLFPISYPLNAIFGHRTFTHSLLFVVILGLLSYFIFPTWVAISVASGVMAHIVGDMLTGKVKFLYPSKKSFGIPIDFKYFTLIDRVARYSIVVVLFLLICKDVSGNSFIL